MLAALLIVLGQTTVQSAAGQFPVSSSGLLLISASTGQYSTFAGSPCSASQYATNISASGALTCAQVTGGQVSGAVATADALSSNPTDCNAGQYANAIAANGNLTCAAVTTAQLSGTITDAQLASNYSGVGACGANTFVSTLTDNAAPTCTQPSFANLSGTITNAQLATQVKRVVTNNVTNSTTTPATITGLSWAVAANTEYGFTCVITATGTSTSLPRYNINGPASPTAVSFTTQRYLTTSTQALLVLQAFSSSVQTATCTSSCATTQLPTLIAGTILNGNNAGTVDLQVTSSTAGQTVTVHRGSYCEVF